MTLFRSNHATGRVPVASLNAALVAGITYGYVTEAVALAANDIIELGPIEPGISLCDLTLASDKLDTNGAPAIQLTVGILNAAKTDIDAGATATWLAASNAAKTGSIDRATSANVYLSGRSDTPRILGVKVATAPATWAGAGKRFRVTLWATA